MAVSRPLPGVRFEAAAPPASGDLPRMDIPAFVGFAASGPIGVPVAVEDAVRFAEIFGDAQPLARDAATGEAIEAYLAPAVRAFFRNGGRRCWIVRLARGAAANRFRLPGLQLLAAGPALADAFAVARSEGSWSDGLRVQTSLVGSPLRFAALVAGPPLAVDVVPATPDAVAVGDLLQLAWLDPSAPVLYLAVESLQAVPLASPLATGVRLTGTAAWVQAAPASPPGTAAVWQLAPQPNVALLPGRPVVQRLSFDLSVRAASGPVLRLSGLGFAPAHPRYWAALPVDSALFADPQATLSGLTADAATPRFPLAGDAAGALYLPVGMGVLPSAEEPAMLGSGTALARDGLVQLDAGLFLDPDLADATLLDLLARADFIRYQRSQPRPLQGVHAVLSLDEVTFVAVPDAVHRGWVSAAGSAAQPLASSPLAHPEWWRWLDCRGGQTPPAGVPLGAGGFIDCEIAGPVEIPLLAATPPEGGTYDLVWAAASGAIDVLQEATHPDFSDAADVATGAPGRVTIHARAQGDLFYRVRRLRGARTSDWSNGVAVHVTAAADYAALGADEYDPSLLRAVHDALLLLCAARGDLFALLSLPGHYDERQAMAHPATLQASARVRSHGALWHPWLILRDGPDGDAAPLKATPHDGATAGVFAARALARGAWIAPANEPLKGPVALLPQVGTAPRQALQDAAVNLIRQEPAGFVCLDADTLCPDDELRAINVRRLLALLRRAALRVGERYVFEPNDGAARRAVQRAFESLLELLFARGAFAGPTAATSFQVVTGDALDTPQTRDSGQLIAELRVAPSRPLSFLTVRLVQDGDATVVQEVGA